MTDTPRHPTAPRLRAMAMPATLLAGLAAAALLTLGALRPSEAAYDPIPEHSIEGVEFLAFDAGALRAALDAACAANGCVAGDLHPMITASAAAMDADELNDALAAQGRILLESQRTALAAAPESEAQRVALLEVTAAARIADLYRAELSRR